jgi:exodeoxyribonuclease V alpha subunit
MSIVLDPSQERAVELVLTAPVGVVTGGPGTGKTTILKTALDRLDKLGVRCLLASPTGKASMRLQEATGREAKTIHRLLGYSPRDGFLYNKLNPLDTDLVIVDESSMIDVDLGADLLEAIDPKRTRLILVGDADQLPPVGPGRVFGDLIDSEMCPVARLDTLHRAALDSWVYRNARRIIRGEYPELAPCADFLYIEQERSEDIVPTIRKFLIEYAPVSINDDVQVLIPQRAGPAGIDKLNTDLQNALNPKKPNANFLQREGKAELREGDRVIQTRNDYTLNVFNGEVGDVVEIDKKQVLVQYTGRTPVSYTLDQAKALQLAYGLTVHKYQGSQAPWVLVVCHSTHYQMLTRQLLYTAVTRAQKGVVLLGNDKGLRAATEAKAPPKRNTGLVARMKGEFGAA